jgi:pimeloyl-ACP methyl ester carboxylesterase
MKLDELGDPEFISGWNGRPILVLQGDRDVSVPKTTVDPAVELIRRNGAEVDYRVYPGEDHFLFFSRSRELFGVTGEWMVKAHRPHGIDESR